MRRLALLVALAACSRSSAPAPAAVSTPAPALASASAPPSPSAAPSASATSSQPSCPRDGSLAARTAEAQSLFGASVRVATIDGTFLFVDPDHSPLFEPSLTLAQQALTALRHDRIAPHPLCPVSAYVFASADRLLKYFANHGYVAEAGKNVGIYDRKRGVIVSDVSGGPNYVPNISHELAHVAMDADFNAAPLWFRECVASLYEAPVIAGTEIHGADNWRYPQLRSALAAHDPEGHLGTLFGMSLEDFRARSANGTDATKYRLHAAMARAICQWLDGKGQLWPFYQGWRDGFADDPDGVATFTRVTGRSPTSTEGDAEWRAWALRTH